MTVRRIGSEPTRPRHRAAPPLLPPTIGLRAARVLTAVLSLLILVGVGVGWTVESDVASGFMVSDALGAGTSDGSANGDVNILLIGLDSRKAMDGSDLPAEVVSDELHAGDSDVGGYNTNTLILLHVPGDGSRATAVAIPRDDWVDVPGYGMHKIKEAYGLAKFDEEKRLQNSGITDPATLEQRSRDAGRKSTLATVQNLLRVPIDHFAEVNLIGFYDIAQALGPIDVCLNAPVQDSYSGADFPAGPQSLNASQALAFVRQRHGLDNGDLDRTHRQQAFLSGVIANLESTGVIGDIGKLQSLLDAIRQDIVIDSGFDPLSFVSRAENLTTGDLDFYTLPITGYETIGGQDVNTVDPARLRTEIAALFGTPATTVDTVSGATAPTGHETVDVINGTARDGLGAATSADLTAQGYHTGTIRTGRATATTTVVYGAGGETDATALAARYGVTATSDRALAAHRIVLTLGADSPDTPPGDGSDTAATPAADTATGTDAIGTTDTGTSDTTTTDAGAPAAPPGVDPNGPQGTVVKADNGIPCVD
ncbi:LCP family protein [Millisia brevis]|uniref:LCP family protein n=1 Tax=Millisia brevis TaxID=264148 RepID=UPI0008346440|nr:LCP family protein [Millisia brevis]